jgi:hypothetical protein
MGNGAIAPRLRQPRPSPTLPHDTPTVWRMPRSAARTCLELVGAPHRLVGDEMGVADGIGRGTRLARPRRVGGSEIAPLSEDSGPNPDKVLSCVLGFLTLRGEGTWPSFWLLKTRNKLA